jgi:hypothetical protein
MLLIVGGKDIQVIELNEERCYSFVAKRIWSTVPGATHLVEKPGALD